MYCALAADDHSRVVLDVVDGSLESDYINANYIDVRRKFIDYLEHQFFCMLCDRNTL